MVNAFIDYVPTEHGLLRPAVVVNRKRKAIAIPVDLASIFAGGSKEDDILAMQKAIEYAAILYDGTFTKNDVIGILDVVCHYMNSCVFAPPPDGDLVQRAPDYNVTINECLA